MWQMVGLPDMAPLKRLEIFKQNDDLGSEAAWMKRRRKRSFIELILPNEELPEFIGGPGP